VPMIEPPCWDGRLDNATARSSRDGPLAWLSGIPGRIAAIPHGGRTWAPEQA
jgi:hypothetical protein